MIRRDASGASGATGAAGSTTPTGRRQQRPTRVAPAHPASPSVPQPQPSSGRPRMAHAAEYINFRSCCRLCLTDRSALNNIFSARNRPLDVAAKIFSVIGIKVTSQDRITTSLCDRCLLHVNNYDNFKNDCLINQVQLAKQLSVFEAQLIDESVVIKDEPIDEDDVVCVSPERCSPPTIKTENTNSSDVADDLPPILSPNYTTEEMLRSLEVQTIEEVETDPALINMNGHEEHDTHETNESQGETAEAQPEQAQETNRSEEAPTIPLVAEDRTATSASDKQDPRDKIAFAATLNLAKKMNDINMEPFTKTEEQYNLRMRIIYTQHKTLICSCHKKQLSSMKALSCHIKKYEGVYLPPFTCANCVTTFSRSYFGKHRVQACKVALYESMHDVSNTVERGVNKLRNYQAFKCMLCLSSARLFEHFLQHVNDHIAIDPTFTCHCNRSFSSASAFRQHMLGPCVMKPSCDMCDKIFDTAEEFRAHCVDVHDDKEGEQFNLADAYEADALPFVALYACVECNLKCKQEMFMVRHLEVAHGYDKEAARRVSEDCYIGPTEGMQNGGDDGDADEDASNLNNNVSAGPPSVREKRRAEGDQHPADTQSKGAASDEIFMSSAIRQLDPTSFECQVCFKTFGYVANVRRHIHQQHLNTPSARRSSSFGCGNCASTFRTMSLLQDHLMTVHFHTCKDCGLKCDSAEELDKHRSSHLKISLTRDPKTHNYRRSDANDAGEDMPMLVPIDPDIKSMTAQCKLCKRYFATTRGLSAHIKYKHKDAVLHRDALTKFPQLCRRKGCHVLLKSVPDWSMHMQMHAEADTAESSTSSSPVHPDDTDYYTCSRCFKVFSNKGNLKQHMKSHSSKPPSPKGKHQCQICKLDCGSAEKLAAHKQSHAPKGNDSVCKVCKVAFGDEEALATHMLDEHGCQTRTKDKTAARKGTFDCHICGKQLPSAESLRGHVGWHKRTGQTQLKSAKKKPPNAISIDTQKLFKKLTFYCICCSELFPTQAALHAHQMRAHVKLRCQTCGKYFQYATELSEHMRTAHVKAEPQVSKKRQASPRLDNLKKSKTGYEYCKICGEEFNAEMQLRDHMLERHPAVPYVPKGSCVCPVCADEFRNSAALSSHLRMHTRRGETVQHPQGAPSSATKRTSLLAASHNVPVPAAPTLATPPVPPPSSAVKDYKYHCGICQKGYNLAPDLRRHILEAHPF